MTDNLHRSVASGNGLSEDSTQGITEADVRVIAELASSPAPQPNLTTEIQVLQILDSSDDCIKLLDLEGRILFMSRGGQALLGIQDITPLLNTSWVKFWQDSEQQAAIEAIQRAGAGEICTIQGYCPSLSGEPKWWDNKISPIRGADGQVERLLCISRDITDRKRISDERKQAEEQLRKSEEHLSTIFSQAAVGLSEISLDGHFQRVNDELCRILGRSREEMLAVSVSDVTYLDDVPKSLEVFRKLIQTGESVSLDKRYLRPDGTIVWTNSSLTRLDDEQGHPRAVLVVTVDLSDRKQAEENLRSSEERYRAIINQALTGVAYSDLGGKLTLVNQKYCDITGYSAAELSQMRMHEITHPDDLSRNLELYNRMLAEGTPFEIEKRYIRKDGSIVWVNNHVSAICDPEGKPQSIVAIVLDISDRRKVERERERFLAVGSDFQAIVGMNGYFRWVSPSFERLLGWATAEMTSRPWTDFVHPDDINSSVSATEALFSSNQPSAFENRYCHKNGSYRWLLWNAQPYPDEQVIYGAAVDITERKLAEVALRDSEEQFRNMADHAPFMVWVTDPTGYCTYLSQSWYDFTGQTPESGLGLGWLNRTHPDDRQDAERIFLDANERQVAFRLEYRLQRKDGEYIWAIDAASPWFGAEGKFKGYVGSVIDISDRKRAEQALQQSEETSRQQLAEIEAIYTTAPVGLCFVDTDLKFVRINQQLAEMNGVPVAAHIGRTLRDILPEMADQLEPLYQQVIASGEPILNLEMHGTNNAQPGVERDWLVSYYPHKARDGRVLGVNVMVQEITDRKRTEAALATDLRDTQLLRDLSARLLTEADVQVLYDEIVATAIALMRSDAGSFQVLDTTTQELLLLASHGFSPCMAGHFDRVDASFNTSCSIALTTHKRAFVDFDVPESEDPNGYRRLHVEAGLLSAQSTPLISRSGKLIGMVSTHWRTQHRPTERELRFLDLLARQAADLIEQRQAEAERKQLLEQEQAAREEAERANRIKDEFLAVLSHELRSPLNPILGWSRLLQSGKLDETKTRQALATIERNAKLQSELIEDLLDVSRILRGKLSLNVAPVNLASIIRSAMETVRLAAEAKSIKLEANLATDIGLVSGDSTRLQQVIWNLLSNAVKFTSVGGQVIIRLEHLDSCAQIIVSDTGQGITPDFLPYVFDYFRQADAATTRKFGGLGLGLAIVRHLVELHGGTVRADSPGEGQGATFTVWLPLMPTTLNANQDDRSPQRTLDLSGIKILIVDDEIDTRELVAFLLEQQGAQVTVATSAQEALLVLPEAKPDLLLSDIGMPDMDGYMLIQQVRALAPEQGGQIPAIALTAYAGDINQQQVIAAGFQRHISKPIEPDMLVQAIAHVVRPT